MHISGKIGIPVGIVMLLLGVGITVSSFSIFEESEHIEDFMTEPSSEITKKFTDEDGGGSAGWYLMIQGEYFVDNNDDNIIDACDGLNISITDSQGNDVNSTSGSIYCELNDNRKLADLDKSTVDISDGWMIVGIVCDTLDDAGMNGYWETYNTDGTDQEKWVETSEKDRCNIGEEYTFSLHYDTGNATTEMVLFDRDAQALLEVEGVLTLLCGLCCACIALLVTIIAFISGFAMKSSNSDDLNVQFVGGGGPVPTSGDGVAVPGTNTGSVFGAGPPAQVDGDTGDEEANESSVDLLKEKFLAATSEKITEDSVDSEKE